MALDPQAQAFLDELAATGAPPLHELAVDEARRVLELQAPRIGERPAVGRVEDLVVPGPAGSLAGRLYSDDSDATLPALVYFHGGGWVTGSLDTHDGVCRELARRTPCVVVSIDYRLAPEHRFPAAVDDCLAATRWVAENATLLGANVERLAVGGDSAGGNLAAAVALRARDEDGPAIAFQLLVYPITNFELTTRSYEENADGYYLTRRSMAWYWDHYIGEDGDGSHPHASPLRAGDLTGLPPALVMTAEFDPLRDEGEAYAKRLADAGVPTELIRYDGMIHGFFRMTKVMDRGSVALDDAARAVRAAGVP